MKQILFLLLLITSIVQGQTTLANKLKITGNLTDNTATKVNVQDANGLVNTISKTDLIDVLEYASAINLPVTGVVGKIYVTIDNNKLYRWNGTIYSEISSSQDVSGKENVSNKASDFTTINNILYPTVQASETRLIGANVVQNIIVVDGDSRPAGYTGMSSYPISDHLTLNLTNKTIYNTADGGATFGDFESEGVQWKQKSAYSNVDTKLSRYGWNILLIWAGYNDMSVRDQNAIITYQKLVGYANARKKAGWRVFVYTEPATTSVIGESRRLEYNLLVRANWSKFADGLVDLGSNEYLGLSGSASNTTYFVDGVHMTYTGYQIAADLSSFVVNRYTDNNLRIVNGETLIQGTPADGTIGTEQILTLQRETLPGISYSNSASLKLGRHTGVGGLFNPYTRLDFNLKSSLLTGYVSDVNVVTMYDTGQTGFGYTSISDMVDYKVAINGKALVNNRVKSTAGIEWGNDVYQVGESRLYNDYTGGTLLTGKTGLYSDFTLINGLGSGVFNNPTGTQNIVFSGSISAINPSFTGTPIVPTATAGTNTNQIASTAFVIANSSPVIPYLEYENAFKSIWNNGLSTGTNNTVYGKRALPLASSTNNNNVFGVYALGGNTLGSNNVAIGNSAGYFFNGGFEANNNNNSIFIGNNTYALGNNQTNQIVIGDNSIGNGSNTTTLGNDSILGTYLKGKVITNNVIRLKNYTVSTLPAGTQGDSAYVTDALAPTYLVAIVGGGSVITPVFYNGTTWVAH